MIIKPKITQVPSGFSGYINYIWLDTKVCVGKKNTIYKLMYLYYIVLKFLMIMHVDFVRFKARN